jgi:hypothetical protein
MSDVGKLQLSVEQHEVLSNNMAFLRIAISHNRRRTNRRNTKIYNIYILFTYIM